VLIIVDSLESVFIREFKNSIVNIGAKDIYSVPLPDSCKGWNISGSELYAIKGIEDEYFGKLNISLVKRIPKGTEAKRRVIDKAKRTFKRDSDGNFIYEDAKIPNGCIVIESDRSIGLPYGYKCKEGCDYIDFIKDKEGTILYLYAIPKKFLYKVNQTALALSVKNMKNYSGMGYVTWNMGKIFLHIIPYNPNSQYVGTKILKTGTKTKYDAEINEIVGYWQKVGLIPNIALSGLSTGENLVMIPTQVGYIDYSPVGELSIGDVEVYTGQVKEHERKVEEFERQLYEEEGIE
jgi:hypothetical protein